MTLNIDSPESAPALPRIAYFPVSFFSMIMGLSGLESCRWDFFIWYRYLDRIRLRNIHSNDLCVNFLCYKNMALPTCSTRRNPPPSADKLLPIFFYKPIATLCCLAARNHSIHLFMDGRDSLANCFHLICDEQLDPPHSLHTITCESKLVYPSGG